MSKKNKSDKLVFWLFVIPTLIPFILVVIIPFITGIYYSFTDWKAVPGREIEWRGVENYVKTFKDIGFIYSFRQTVLYTIFSVISINAVAFGLAILVTRNLKLSNVYRAGFFIPNLIGGLILGYIWQFIFNSFVPMFAKSIGSEYFVNNLLLTNGNTAFAAIIMVATWQYAGYIMMIYVAAIQNVPQELIEAAELDGAGVFDKLKNITLPMVAQAFTVTSFLTLTSAFKQFDVVFALTGGGPATFHKDSIVNATEFLALNLYKTAFSFNDMAQAQARAVFFFAILLVISIIQVAINKSREVEM